MKPTQKLILTLGLIWIGVKMTLFLLGKGADSLQITVSLNIGFTLFIIYKALQYFQAETGNTDSGFVKEFTTALKAASFYSLIIFGFMVIYYVFIDKQFPESVVEDRMIELKEKIQAEGGFEVVMEKYKDEITLPEGQENLTEEEYYEEVKVNYIQMMAPRVYLPLIFMGLFFLNIAGSALVAGIYRRIRPQRL